MTSNKYTLKNDIDGFINLVCAETYNVLFNIHSEDNCLYGITDEDLILDRLIQVYYTYNEENQEEI